MIVDPFSTWYILLVQSLVSYYSIFEVMPPHRYSAKLGDTIQIMYKVYKIEKSWGML